MGENKAKTVGGAGAAAAARPQGSSSGNPFKEIFEVTVVSIETLEKDLESKMRVHGYDDEAKVSASRERLKEVVDHAASVVETAQGYAGIREQAAELMRTVRRVRREHLGLSSSP